jgi:ethanolamine ammonia-lyase small subunit
MSPGKFAAADPVEINAWHGLRKFTAARIALGRTGESLPTAAVLDFGLAHAQARDAVHVPMDAAHIETQLAAAGFPALHVHSAAKERREYLVRPDYGRKLDDASRSSLHGAKPSGPIDAVIVIADGLSAFAPSRHAVPFLKILHERLAGWRLAPIVVALQSRVALGDEIGGIFDAEMVVMLIGERPGLSSPDSLGIYLTYRPHVGRSDAERNCISNVRPGGLDFQTAAFKLHYLMENARRLQLTGVDLKDDSDTLLLPGGKIPIIP